LRDLGQGNYHLKNEHSFYLRCKRPKVARKTESVVMARLADPELAERRRRQILDAALTCFRRSGFHQASMAEICAEAQMSPGTVYRYFASKTDLIVAIGADERAALSAKLAAMDRGLGLHAILSHLAEEMFGRFYTASEAPVSLDVMAEAVRDPTLGALLRQDFQSCRKPLQGAIAAARAKGEIDPAIDPARAARLVMAAIDGIGMHLVVKRGDINEAAQDFRALVNSILRPVASGPPQRAAHITKALGDIDA
jgi:AcrR family transcriptional regulator